ncbi:cell division protein PerM [Actinacidiphila reveromycinica]|uniref:cell division protein PerM n=1 Tax=Actinacidiphila reveromycinica TaxID=659352 RepID=UPI001921985B|nr:DUF6350 family protein [Streptomyces sp. SN-593]
MTQTTEPLTASVSAPPPRWAALRVSALAAGASAAGLGLGGIAAVVLMLWIGSPFPDTGLGDALHVSADLWLLAQGADLLRDSTLSGDPAPVGIAPLLLSALPAWLVFRGTASAVAAAVDGKDPDDAGGPGGGAVGDAGFEGRLTGPARVRAAAAVTGWVLAGYLTLAAVVAVYATGGSVHVDPVTAPYAVLFAGAAAGCGAWAGCGRPGPELLPLDRFRGGRLYRMHRAYAEEVGAAVRAATGAAALLVAGGALIGAAALIWHAGAVGRTYEQLSGPLVGQVSVLLVAVGLVPNLAVWAASYALGAGFTVGVGGATAPAGSSGHHLLLPGFPLLAALPHAGTSWIGWATLALPVLAALGVAWFVGNDAWPVWSTVRVTAGAALALGAGFAVLAAWAGGPLGAHRLAEFGPVWWRAGAAAAGWTLAIALPASLVLRYHVAHPPHPWRSLVGELRMPRLRVPRPRLPDVAWARRRGPAGGVTAKERPGGAGSAAVPVPKPAPAAPRPAFPSTPAAPGPASSTTPAAFPPPLPGLAPALSDPLPWPAPEPLPLFPPPLFPPPLPDLPPSAPPTAPAPSAPPRPSDPPPSGPPSHGAPPTEAPVVAPAEPPAPPATPPAEPPAPPATPPAEPPAPPAAPPAD